MERAVVMKKFSFRMCLVVMICMSISFVIAGDSYAQPIDTQGLEGYWRFDEGSGSVVIDHSGKGRNLTIAGNPSWTAGKNDKAFSFDGNTVLILDGRNQIRAYNFTISMFVKINDFPMSDTGANILIANEGVSALGQGSVDFGFFGGKLYSYVTGMQWDRGDRVAGNTDFTSLKQTWHHIAVVYNQDYNEEIGKSFVFVNGNLDGSAELTMTVGGDIILGFPRTVSFPKYNATIGGFRDDSRNILRSIIGEIDDLMIFSRALSNDEIAILAGVKQPETQITEVEVEQPAEPTQTPEVEKEKEPAATVVTNDKPIEPAPKESESITPIDKPVQQPNEEVKQEEVPITNEIEPETPDTSNQDNNLADETLDETAQSSVDVVDNNQDSTIGVEQDIEESKDIRADETSNNSTSGSYLPFLYAIPILLIAAVVGLVLRHLYFKKMKKNNA